MKLSDIKKSADEKKAAKLAEERKAKILVDLDIHPLVKEGYTRNIRDAYFCGIAFAAFTDDLKMDAQERKSVCRIGCSLGISDEEQDEMIRAVQHDIEHAVKDGGEGVFALLEDCADEIKEESARRLFAAEYVKVCASKEYDHDDVCSCLAQYVYRDDDEKLDKQMTTLCEQLFSASGKVDSAVLVDLSAILGDDVVRYLMLDVCGDDVASLLKMERDRRKAAEAARQEQKRVEEVRSRLEAEMDRVASEYDHCASMPDGWHCDLYKRLSFCAAEDVDVMRFVNAQRIALKSIPHCYSKLVIYGQEKRRRRIVWKLVCLLVVMKKQVPTISVDDMLGTAKQLSTEGYNEKVDCYMRHWFGL